MAWCDQTWVPTKLHSPRTSLHVQLVRPPVFPSPQRCSGAYVPVQLAPCFRMKLTLLPLQTNFGNLDVSCRLLLGRAQRGLQLKPQMSACRTTLSPRQTVANFYR